MEEVWKPIKDYEGLYEISSYGRVRSLPEQGTPGRYIEGKIRIPQKRGRYLFVRLSKNGHTKGFSIHRLVAEAFIPNPENKPVVDHIDGNAYNNNVDNLRWASFSENSRNPITLKRCLENRDTAGGKRASQETIVYYNGVYCFTFPSQSETARQLNISRRSLYACLKNNSSWKGYTFTKR